MHNLDEATRELAQEIVDYVMERISMQPLPLDGPRSKEQLSALYGPSITEDGIGGIEALKRFREGFAPATLSSDHPRFLAFVPVAPSKAAILFDLVVSASSISGTSWLEGAGAIHCENEALRWLADIAKMGDNAGGTFVSGGSAANLSGLHTARHTTQARLAHRPKRWAIVTSADAHSSISTAASIMDAEVIVVEGDERGRLCGRALEEKLTSLSTEALEGVFAIVATAGTTNAGIVDDLAGVTEVAKRFGIWVHVDGAYGGAGLASTLRRDLFVGMENVDSFVVDPHKWLFAPFDCAALLYRDPSLAARAHTQEASYLDDINHSPDWNPSSYAYHLTRRVRGLPFWFSLAANGTAAYSAAVDVCIEIADFCAAEIRERPNFELAIEPELSVVVFRRVGWQSEDYERWCKMALEEEIAFCLPTTFRGERLMRLCFVNPGTTKEDVELILDSMSRDL